MSLARTADRLRQWWRFGRPAPWDWIVATGFYAAVVAVFLGDSIFGDRVLLPADTLFVYDPWRAALPASWPGPANRALSDPITQFYPYLSYARERLLAFQMPLWNPYTLAGTPFLASQQTAVLYPLNLLVLLLPIDRAPAASAALRLLLAGVGTFLLGRQLGLSFPGALLSGLAWMLSAFNVLYLLFPHVNTTVLLPWVLLFSLRVLATGDRRDVALLALASGSASLGGHGETLLEFVVICVPVLGMVWVRLLRAEGPSRAWARLGWTACGGALGLGLSAIAILPFVDYVLDSSTLDIRNAMARNPFVLPGYSVVTLMNPRIFGDVLRPTYWGPSSFYEGVSYVGVVTLVLVGFAVGRATRDWRVVAFGGAALLAWLVVTGQQPVFDWITSLPGFKHAPNSRLRFVVEFGLAILSGIGFDSLLSSRGAAGRRELRAGLLGVGAVGVVGGFALETARQAMMSPLSLRLAAVLPKHEQTWQQPSGSTLNALTLQTATLSPELARWLLSPALSVGAAWFGAGLVVAGIALTIVRRNAGRPLASLLIPLLLASDLITQWQGVNPTAAPDALYPASAPAISYLRSAEGWFRVVGTPGMVLVPNSSLVLGLHDIRGYELPMLRRYSRFFAAAVASRGSGYQLYIETVDSRRLRYLSLLGVRYVVATEAYPAVELTPIVAGRTGVYENANAMPAAFMVSEWLESTADESLLVLAQPDFDPTRTAVVEPPDASGFFLRLASRLPQLAGAPPSPASARRELARDWRQALRGTSVAGTARAATVVMNEPERLVVDVDAGAEGFLVVSTAYDPGWRATVNGGPSVVQPCDHGLQAVRVSAGVSRVELTYLPESYQLGVAISGFALLAVAWLALAPALRRAG